MNVKYHYEYIFVNFGNLRDGGYRKYCKTYEEAKSYMNPSVYGYIKKYRVYEY